MNFRELLNKIDEGGWDINDPNAAAKQQALNQQVQANQGAAAAPAAPAAGNAVWTPTPEQVKWLGGADQQDPYILSRMPGAKPPVSWFKDPADQTLAKRLGFPEKAETPAAPTSPTAPAAQAAADDQGKALAIEKLKQLNALLAKLKPGEKRTAAELQANQDVAASGLEEGIDTDIARQLIESFGYTQEQLDELSMQDVGDFGRGAWQGATLGTGNNIAAGAKSLFKGTKYKDELAGELAADKAAQERSPIAYGSGNVAGAVGSSFAIPGAGLGNLAARGAAKLGAGALGQGLARGATQVGANLAIQKGVDTAVAAHNKDVLGDKEAPATNTAGGDQKLMQLQKIIGAKPDGKMGPETQQKLIAWQQSQGLKADGMPGPLTYGKAGIKESVAEQYARLRDRLAMLEAEEQTDEGVASSLWQAAKTGFNPAMKVATGATTRAGNPQVVGQTSKAFQQALAARPAVERGAYAAGQAANKVAGAAKTVGGAMARNPGKTALATAAGAYGLSQLGDKPAATTTPTTPTNNTGTSGQSGADTGTTTGQLDQATLDQINQLMSELSQFDIPEIQQGLVQARQTLAQLSGDKNVGSADKPAAAPAAPAKPELTPQQQAQNVLQPGMNK